MEVRLVYGSEWGKVGVAEVSFGRGPGRRSRTERTVSFLRTIEGGGKGGESNWTGINDLPITCMAMSGKEMVLVVLQSAVLY